MVPKMALIRGNGGLDIRFCVRDPEKTHPWAEPRVLAYFASKSVQGTWLLASCKNPKKLTRFWCAKSLMCRNDTPDDRVAVDLVGPIFPATEKGYKYILTMVDYATRYPEAQPLKDIHTETVAEALVNMFARSEFHEKS